MPSGAKKRKAAKKRKEQQAYHKQSNSNTPLGHDDPKSQDERESDSGDASSPASQGHHNQQHPFKKGNGVSEKRDPTTHSQSFDAGNKSMDEVARGLEGAQKVGVEYGDAVNVYQELKSKEDSGNQSIGIKHVEFVKESSDGSSSSSSSDNESHVVEKTMTKAGSQNGENMPVDSFTEEVNQGTEISSLGDTELHVEVAKESSDGSSSSSSSDNESHVVEKTMTKTVSENGENRPVDSFTEEVIQGTGKLSLPETDNTDEKTVKPLVSESEKVIHATQDESVVIPVVTEVVESLKENEESKTNEEKVIPLMDGNVGACSNAVETVTNENEDKILPTSVTPTAETSKGGGSLRETKIPDFSENQPLIASAPRVEQRTSWLSCCGLLEVLTGSGR